MHEVSANRALLPRTGWAYGRIKAKIEQIQRGLVDELTTLDAAVQQLVQRRHEVVADLHRCRDAFGGIGNRELRRVPLPDEVKAVPDGTHRVDGRILRDVTERMVLEAGRPVSLTDVHRMLLARGISPAGHPTKGISDALRPAVASGRIVRLSRGVYVHTQQLPPRENAGVMAGRSRDELDAYIDAVLVGGREPAVIEIVAYRPEWAARFAAEQARIAAALGPTARRIEHVGSTAVPGLAAKPIVDVMVTVDDPDEEASYLSRLQNAGYELRVREPGHRMFRTPQHDVHVHVWAAGGDEESRLLLFRDRLRADAADREEYELTKRQLAGRYADANYYAEAKTETIERIIRAARPGS